MRNLSLKHIETVQAIAAAGSLVRAAAALNMTPAALTARVKALEDAVESQTVRPDFRPACGSRKLARRRSKPRASSSGRFAISPMRCWPSVLEKAGGSRLAPYRPRNISRPRLIAAFLATRPKVDLRFQIGNRDATVDLLRNGEIEIALAGRPPREMAVETFALGPHPYVLIAPPEHRFAGARGLIPSRSGRGSVPVPGDRLRHAIAVRRLYRRHEHQARSDAHGAWVRTSPSSRR